MNGIRRNGQCGREESEESWVMERDDMESSPTMDRFPPIGGCGRFQTISSESTDGLFA